jgi:sec-independent protein translocase protein TatA
MAGLTGWHLLILLAVVVLLFGAKRLPDMARAIAQSTRILKGEIKATTTDDHIPTHHQPSTASPAIEQPRPSATPAQQPTHDTTYPRTP